MSFIFGGNTGLSYEEMVRMRELADALGISARDNTPDNVGEGLQAVAQAFASRALRNRAGKAEAAGKKEADALWNSVWSQRYASPGGATNASYTPEGATMAPARPSDPNEALAADAMAAIGKGPAGVDFASFEKKAGLPVGYLSRTAQIESGMNPSAKNPNSSAGGLFQFIDATASQYGLADKFDPMAATDAAARLAADNAEILRKTLGREPTGGELYLAHQQGAGGAARLLANPNARAVDIVGADAVRLNGGSADMTAGEFAGKWVNKFGASGDTRTTDASAGLRGPNGNTGLMGVDPVLLEAAQNPYMNDQQRSMLGMLIEEQIKRNQPPDPMADLEYQRAQLGLQRDQVELDRLQNPRPEIPSEVREREMLAERAGLKPGTPEYQVYMATGELPNSQANVPATFASLDMQARAAGYEPGTPEYQEFMRNGGGSGAPAAFIALDLQAQAAGFQPGTPEYQQFMATRGAGLSAEASAAGKARGEDRALLESTASKMAGLEDVVAQLEELADQATYTIGGQFVDAVRTQTGMEPRASAVARAKYIAMVDNQVLPMLRDTFGAAFTVKEGETLRATLGDPDKSPAAKKEVLRAFIAQKKRDLEALEKRTGQPSPPDAAAESGGLTDDDLRYLGAP